MAGVYASVAALVKQATRQTARLRDPRSCLRVEQLAIHQCPWTALCEMGGGGEAGDLEELPLCSWDVDYRGTLLGHGNHCPLTGLNEGRSTAALGDMRARLRSLTRTNLP